MFTGECGGKDQVRRAYLLSVFLFCEMMFELSDAGASFCFSTWLLEVVHSFTQSYPQVRKTAEYAGNAFFYRNIHDNTKRIKPSVFNGYRRFETSVLLQKMARFIHSMRSADFSCSQIYPQKDKLST